MKLFKSVFVLACLCMMFGFTQSEAFANCDYSCTVNGPYLPCPTWSEPGRQCQSSYDDPTCLARRSVCHQTFAACVTAALSANGFGGACIAGVIADAESAGAVTAATIALCGAAAESVQQIANNCN